MGLVENKTHTSGYLQVRSGRVFFELPQNGALGDDGNLPQLVEENLQQAQLKAQEALQQQTARERAIEEGTQSLTAYLEGVTSLTLFDHKKGENRDIFKGIPTQVSKRTTATPQELSSRRAKRLIGLYKRGAVAFADIEKALLQLPQTEDEEGQRKVDGLMGELWATGVNNKALQKQRRALGAYQSQVAVWQTWKDYYRHQQQVDKDFEALCCQLREASIQLISSAQTGVQVAAQRGYLSDGLYDPQLADLRERRSVLLSQIQQRSKLIPAEVLKSFLAPQTFEEIFGQYKLAEWKSSIAARWHSPQEAAVLNQLQDEVEKDTTYLARLTKRRGIKKPLGHSLVGVALSRHQQFWQEETIKNRQHTVEKVWNPVSEYRRSLLEAEEVKQTSATPSLRKLVVLKAQASFQALGGFFKKAAGVWEKPQDMGKAPGSFSPQGSLEFQPQVRT